MMFKSVMAVAVQEFDLLQDVQPGLRPRLGTVEASCSCLSSLAMQPLPACRNTVKALAWHRAVYMYVN